MKMQPGCPVGIQGGTPRYALVLQWGPGVIWDEFCIISEGPRRTLWDLLATSFQLNLALAGQRNPKETPKVLTARRLGFHEASQRASSGPRPSFYAKNGVNSSVLARSQYCSFGVKSRARDTPKWAFRNLFRLLGLPVGSFWRPSGFPKPIRKAFEKKSKFRRFLGPPGGRVPLPPAGLPGQHKTHIFNKSSDFVAEGCEFSISGFRCPLREVTFSDFL